MTESTEPDRSAAAPSAGAPNGPSSTYPPGPTGASGLPLASGTSGTSGASGPAGAAGTAGATGSAPTATATRRPRAAGPERDDWDRTFGGARTAERVEGRPPGFVTSVLTALRELVIIVVLATILSLVVKTWLVQAFYIPSGSMENTLVLDDRVIVSKLTPSHIELQRGDIVVFSDPAHWLGTTAAPEPSSPVKKALQFVGLVPEDSDEHLIKRVIGLPGDTVECCTVDGKLKVNGVPITEPYVKPGSTAGGDGPPFSITVPAGRVWVMGDNRSNSADSRYHDDGTGATGSVPIADITGRAILLVWPLDRVTWLTAPGSVFGSVPDPGATRTTPATTTGTTGTAGTAGTKAPSTP